ncbi:SDR family NAD(P)-dependent oxidoreductase [Spirosoma pollinicola]|uniref:SDR family NAD(P)-dependent oxidoreductase n=1 Tax=Spirosoma pollinicola TaxID=2057025 RepID=UPI00197F2F7B|nr:SDR family NAD(P)-dependent oxidoreductase [Spirosoma pollinicola]
MNGKIVLITGGSSGVGKATAIAIAQRGAKVVIVSRSEARGQVALAEIALKTGNNAGELITADLSLQSSVRALAAAVKQRYARLDGLMNLAGGINVKKQLTQEGVDPSFAINYLSHFLLTQELLDILQASTPSRVVTVSGNPAFIKRAKLDFAVLQGTAKYSGMRAAAQAMFARVSSPLSWPAGCRAPG